MSYCQQTLLIKIYAINKFNILDMIFFLQYLLKFDKIVLYVKINLIGGKCKMRLSKFIKYVIFKILSVIFSILISIAGTLAYKYYFPDSFDNLIVKTANTVCDRLKNDEQLATNISVLLLNGIKNSKKDLIEIITNHKYDLFFDSPINLQVSFLHY